MSNPYFPAVNGTSSITIPVDMPADDSDMDQDDMDPISPLSMPSPFNRNSVDSTSNNSGGGHQHHASSFLSHSFPTQVQSLQQGRGVNPMFHSAATHRNSTSAINTNTNTTATQARSPSSMYIPSSSTPLDSSNTSPPPPSSSTNHRPASIGGGGGGGGGGVRANPGAMSFEELLAMYYSGANAATLGTSPPNIEPNMLSSLLQASQSANLPLAHMTQGQLVAAMGGHHGGSSATGNFHLCVCL